MPVAPHAVPGVMTEEDAKHYDHYLRGWTQVPFLEGSEGISAEGQADWEEAQQQQAAADARFLSRTGLTRQEALARIEADYDDPPKWW